MADIAHKWDHLVITPCYIIYSKNRHTSLWMLHNLWDEYTDNYNSLDLENKVQGWHGIMALQAIFRERDEWDEKSYGPIPLHSALPGWKAKGLSPGTEAWKQYWKEHPNEQEGMARHAIRLRSRENRD